MPSDSHHIVRGCGPWTEEGSLKMPSDSHHIVRGRGPWTEEG